MPTPARRATSAIDTSAARFRERLAGRGEDPGAVPLDEVRCSGRARRAPDESELTLVQLATAWAARHPAVRSVVIGPRTMPQLDGYLAADTIDLSDDVLDHIDAIVQPGVTLDVTDTMWVHGTRALDPAQRRR